jgi:acetyl esterase/lipase
MLERRLDGGRTFALLSLALLIPVAAPAQCLDPIFSVGIQSNVVYGTGLVDEGDAEMDLLLDVYTPAGDSRPDKPAAVLVHGGSFTGGSKTNPLMIELGQLLASRGFVAVSIDYRLFGDDPPVPAWMQQVMDAFGITPSHPEYPRFRTAHAAAMDTRIAVRWLRENAQAYGIDPDRVAGIGSSAGAFCALVAGIIDEPAFDFERLNPGDPILYPAQSPITAITVDLWGTLAGFLDFVVDADDSPTMIVHGTNDTVVPYSEAVALANRATTVGLDHELWPLPGVGHGAPLSIDVAGEPLSERILDFLGTRLDLCRCGNGSVEPGEECETDGSDPCCSSDTCAFTTAPCDDGELCTHADTCSEGVCAGSSGPDPTCRGAAAPAGSILTIRDRDGAGRDSLAWRWKRGIATDLADFGDPTSTTDYAVCAFAGEAGDLFYQAELTAGAQCGSRPCWSDKGARGFQYKDTRATIAGIRKLQLKPGDEGRARIKLDTKSFELAGVLPVEPPATIQLRRLDADVCWGAAHDDVRRNDPSTFKARGQ